MILYGLKNCDTCRKALKALPQAEFVDVRADGVPEAVLERALVLFGDGVVNTRSTTWRGLATQDRTAPPLQLLQGNPSLMKRPLIVDEDEMWLGWDKDVQAALAHKG
jgi:arsenate reductase